MAKFVCAMNVSLDRYVDHEKFAPGPTLFRHWIECVREVTGSVYGRGMYEIMRYWDDDQPGWSADEFEFAEVWRKQPKWVVSRSLSSVGPNATLITDHVETALRELKMRYDGEIDVSGPNFARSLAEFGLIDEYRLYYHPVVLGSGRPFFVGPRPAMRFVGSEMVDENVIRLRYVPA
jgi:dihydrofolate reductase